MPTLDGKVKMKIPAGTQSGKVFRLKGKGIPHLHGGRARRPARAGRASRRRTELTAKQRELLERFAEASTEVTHPQSKSFFEKVKQLFG